MTPISMPYSVGKELFSHIVLTLEVSDTIYNGEYIR